MPINIPDKAMSKIVESADKHLAEPFDNTIRPSSEVVGESFGTICKAHFSKRNFKAKIKDMSAEKALERFKELLDENYKKIPIEKLVNNKPYEIIKALEDAEYCIYEDNLREMFAKLITANLNNDKADDVHPAFSSIIRQMDPCDAIILKSFAKYEYQTWGGLGYDLKIESKKIRISICNLVRLGLVKYDSPNMIENIDTYLGNKLRNNDYYSHYDKPINESEGVALTEFGKQFVSVCCE